MPFRPSSGTRCYGNQRFAGSVPGQSNPDMRYRLHGMDNLIFADYKAPGVYAYRGLNPRFVFWGNAHKPNLGLRRFLPCKLLPLLTCKAPFQSPPGLILVFFRVVFIACCIIFIGFCFSGGVKNMCGQQHQQVSRFFVKPRLPVCTVIGAGTI